MRYFVAGGTSNTGTAVVRRLAGRAGKENIVCLARPTSDTRGLETCGVKIHIGDMSDPSSFQPLVSDETIYLDMTHATHYHVSIDAAVRAGVRRAYFVTTTGIFSRFRRVTTLYLEGEKRIRESGIVYTIIRPSMIYGSTRDRNMNRLISFLDRYPVMPLFGDGSNLMQPVFFEDLAGGIVDCIDNPVTENQEYNLAGPEPIRYREMIETIARLLGRKARLICVNAGLAYQLVRLLQWIPGFPIYDEQVLRMKEDKVFDITKARAELGYSPRPFEEGIALEIAEMRSAGQLRPALRSQSVK